MNATYQCPLCGKKTSRDLAVYLEHTQEHVIDVIKKKHPEWVAKDGTCRPCVEYYRSQLSGDLPDMNLGPAETRKRLAAGIFSLSVFLLMGLVLWHHQSARVVRLVLWLPLFLSLWCFLEARKKTCSVLAEKGVCNLDRGIVALHDPARRARIRRLGRRLIVIGFLLSGMLTFFIYLLPAR